MTLRRRACRALCAGCCALGLALPARAQVAAPVAARMPVFQTSTSASGKSRPDIEPARVFGQVFAGAYAGIGGYVIGTWAGGLLAEALPASEKTRDQISFGIGVIGGGLATAASVAAVGNIGDQTGSYPMALVGTAGGIAIGALLNQLLYGHARLPAEGLSSRARWVEASLEALLPSLGATIAFNSTRRYK